jgi:large conductance mechanosensitive channel
MIKIGTFINTVIDFLIVAFCIFMVVKGFNQLRKKEEAKPAAPPAPTEDQKLLAEIRDILKAK